MVAVDLQVLPSVHTEDVSTLVSNSGMTRYRVHTGVWDKYSNDENPYEFFPKGIFVEQFDSLFHVEVSLVADTAYHYEKDDLWHAIGNVVVKNAGGRTFETAELFWNNKIPPDTLGVFYTHQLVTITEPDGQTLLGHNGFESIRSLRFYRLYSNTGEFLHVEDQEETPPDTVGLTTVLSDSIRHP